MANAITYKQIIGILKNIAERHFQINSFYLGRDWELENDNDIAYPVFQVYPESATMPITLGEYKTINVSLNCKVVDLVRQNESNEKDVHSDCLRICQDIINELNQHPFYIRSNASLVGDINITALEEFEDDFAAGWGFTLNLKLINVNSYCGLPFEEITGYSANGPVSTGYSQSVQYLTCSNVLSCSTLSDYLEDYYVNVEGDTMTGPLVINAGASGFTYVDGNEGAGKVLVTDANGVAYWDNPPAYSLSQFMFISGASSISGYHQAIPLSQYSASTLVSYSTGLTTTARVMGIFATNAGQPNTTVLPAGNFTFNFDTQKASGSIAYFTHAELYKRNTGGTETFLLSSETSSVSILNTNISNSLNGVSSSAINLDVTDRLVVKIYGRTSSSTATVSLRIDGTTNAGLIMPVNAASSADFVPYTNASDDVDLGSFTITAGAFYGNGSGITGIDHTAVQAGSNITTGGTASVPIISTVASPSFNNLTLSGTGIASAFSATTLSAGTYYSGSTPLTTIITTIAAGSSSGGGFSGWTGSSGINSIVMVGGGNTASGSQSLAVGTSNTASGEYSSVVGGYLNSATDRYTIVGGGYSNSAQKDFDAVLGGRLNQASGFYSTIGGGSNNTISASKGSILGGQGHLVSGTYGVVGGGSGNTSSGLASGVFAGTANTASSECSVVGGGKSNVASNFASTVAGGWANTSSGMYSFSVGRANTASGVYSTVSGGFANLANQSGAGIHGGRFNVASGVDSIVDGGNSNRATSTQSIIGSGYLNFVSGTRASVLNGNSNSASTTYATVIGGKNNLASAEFSTIVGGSGITATQINTAYVPFLNIQSATTDASVDNVLVRDSTGKVFIRDASTIGTAGNFLPLSGGTVTGDTIFTTAISAATISAETITYEIYSETASTLSTTYTINGNNGNYQVLTFNTGTTITYSNMKPGYYNFLINLTGTTTLTLSGSSGWYTPNAIPVGFYQPLTLMSCIYDGSKMIVSTYEQLSEIV